MAINYLASSKNGNEKRNQTAEQEISFFKGYLQILQEELLNNPNAGVNLGSGIRKVRMAIGSKGRGKSHGAKVTTVQVII